MGTNVHAFAHRLTALSMACLASAGIIFCALSGLGCSFIQIQAFKGQSVGNANGDVFEDAETAYLGVQCLTATDAPFYDTDGGVDRLWSLTRIFFYVGLTLGAMTTLFAWMLGSCVRPTPGRWRVLSILAALAAVFQIPMFLVIESDNCNFDISRQTCVLSIGAYLNVASISIWIAMTIWVQCLRAPRWDEEIDAWRVNGNKGSSSSPPPAFVNITGEDTAYDKRMDEMSDGIGGDQTAETIEIGMPHLDAREQSTSFQKSGNGSRTENIPTRTNDHEQRIRTKAHTETVDSISKNTVPLVDKSVAADTGNAVNLSQNSETATSSTNNQVTPGLHMSCVHLDGTRQEAHFPALPNCCLGMLGDATEEEAETKFRTFPKVSDEYGMVEFDDYDLKNSASADFLLRRLQKEEEAAAARRAEHNMAPVASLEFTTKNNRKNGDRRKNRKKTLDSNVAINDDVSEMTRGSGWASGVSEILDDSDLRHQPKAIIKDLIEKY